jgi:hypothetical protein
VAVLKYRLYDIDILINRTLVYVPLTAIVAGLYVALTGLFRAVFTELTDTGSDAAIAISTLAVVAVLTPLKNQLQSLVDRHFKEQQDSMAGARRLATQARSLLEVLDARQFAETYLTELATGLNADGVRLDVDYPEPWSVTIGEPDEMATLDAPLLHQGTEIGTLTFWLTLSSRRDENAARDAVTDAAGLLAQIICLAPQTRATGRLPSPAQVAP